MSASYIHHLNPQTLYNPTPNAYSHLTRLDVRHLTEIIHIAGQGGEDKSGNLSPDFKIQCQNVFLNLQHALNSAEISWSNIAQMTILVVQHNQEKHQSIIQLMQHYFSNQQFPACTLIPVSHLALPQMLIEIDAMAYRF